MNKSINKTELIHIRIEPDVKVQSENIFKRLGVNTSYAVSMFLNQVILRGGFPFEIELPKNNNEEYTNLAMIIESTAGNGKVHAFKDGNSVQGYRHRCRRPGIFGQQEV